MTAAAEFDIFLAAPPGLEPVLRDEAAALGFRDAEVSPGGVLTRGGWPEVWRANLKLRGAGEHPARVGAFHAVHLAQLDKRARRLPWADILPPGAALRVDAACQRSRIWHAGAAAQRIARAATEAVGGTEAPEAEFRILARIVEDHCVVSIDASGEPLHKRGHKLAVGKAPLRETLAALFLRACGYDGAEPVVDPMCGSGTFILEAAEIALGLDAGRGRDFAFQRFPGFDAAAFAAMRSPGAAPGRPRFFGMDRDAGAVEAAEANAARAGVAGAAEFRRQAVSALAPPEALAGEPGLVVVNPPYGERIGEKGDLRALYGSLGQALRERFRGWRVGVVTSEPALAQAAGLPFLPPGPPVPHGPLKVRLHRTDTLP